MRLLSSCLLACLALGCGKDSAGPATAPATAPASTQAAGELPPLRLKIVDREFVFSPAVLSISGQAPRLSARLYNSDQGGDRETDAVYFDCPLELEPDAPLTEATHRFRTDNHERTEALTGIFLPRERVKLQPLELSIDLADAPGNPAGGEPQVVLVKLSGKFLVFPEDVDVATNLISAAGTFPARVKRD